MDWNREKYQGRGEKSRKVWNGRRWNGRWTGDDRKSFSYFGYRFVGMPVRLVARFGIPPAILRSTAGDEATRFYAKRFLSFSLSLSLIVLIKLARGEGTLARYPPFLSLLSSQEISTRLCIVETAFRKKEERVF